MVRSCSKTYFYKHFFDVFGPSYAMTMNGIYKGRQPGQLRSNTEKKSIADYVNKCRQLAFDLGVL